MVQLFFNLFHRSVCFARWVKPSFLIPREFFYPFHYNSCPEILPDFPSINLNNSERLDISISRVSTPYWQSTLWYSCFALWKYGVWLRESVSQSSSIAHFKMVWFNRIHWMYRSMTDNLQAFSHAAPELQNYWNSWKLW